MSVTVARIHRLADLERTFYRGRVLILRIEWDEHGVPVWLEAAISEEALKRAGTVVNAKAFVSQTLRSIIRDGTREGEARWKALHGAMDQLKAALPELEVMAERERADAMLSAARGRMLEREAKEA